MKPVKMIQMLLSLLLMVALLCGNAQAALKAVGPTSIVSTLPTWYQDATDLALEPCLDQNGFCILTPNFDPAGAALRVPPGPLLPITTTGPINDANFPNEFFYFLADALIPNVGIGSSAGPGKPLKFDNVNFRIAMEAAFLGGVSPGTGITFLRVNLQKITGLTPNSIYTVTHPYGSFQFSTDSAGNSIVTNAGQTYRVEDPVTPTQGLYFPPQMQQAVQTHVGPFLKSSGGLVIDPGTGHTYIGVPTIPTTVTGSPNNTNFLQIDGPDIGGTGIHTISTNLFNLSGRVFTGPIARPLTIDRSTYARDANSGQVDIFVSSLANANIQVSGTGITTTLMTPDTPSTGNYFLNIPLASSTLPTSVALNNSLDLNGPIPHPVTLVDEVNITEAHYNQVTKVLTVKAASRDQVAPLPTLSVAGFAAPNTLDSTGTFTKTLADIPPQTVTIVSINGGAATAPISVGVVPLFITTADPLPNATIGTLYNQTIAFNGGVAPYTWSAPIGTLPPGINFFPGSGTLFGNPTTPGTYSFTLQLTDSLGTTVIKPFNLTVVAQPNPIAVDDTATTPAGSTIVINVLGNDTATVPKSLNPTTLSVSAATGGTVTPNLDGTVSYTAPATLGSYSFNYSVKDNAASPYTSNIAAVVVTVTAAPAVTFSVPSPQVVGTTITLTGAAAGVGGSGPYEYQYYVSSNGGGSWTLLKPWSTVNTYAWNTTGLPSGTYTVQVNVRNVGSTLPFGVWTNYNYTLTGGAVAEATGSSMTFSVPSPQVVGTAITLTGAGVGGSGTYEYQYYVSSNGGGSWTLLKPWSTVNTYAWNTTGVPSGTYTVQVNVRNVGSTLPFGVWTNYNYTLTGGAVAEATGSSMTFSVPSPQVVGTTITLTGAGVGGSGTYEYQYYVTSNGGGSWTLLNPWSTVNTYAWNTTGVPSGTYTVQVNVRNVGSTLPFGVWTNYSYTLI